ncbi:MAG: FecR domain-containing protein [Pseudomonadota bacterium]
MGSTSKNRLQVKREAYEWHLLLLNNEAVSVEDRRRFETWLAQDPGHRAAYDRASVAYLALGTLEPAQIDSDVLVIDSKEAPDFASGRLSRLLRGLAARPASYGIPFAAAIAGLAVFLVLQPERTPPAEAFVTVQPDVSTYETARGELQEFTLNDGSSVTLAPASVLRVTMSQDSRHLSLTRGAGQFHVAKDAQRPFTVAAGHIRATALGTVFEVRNNGGALRVAVEEGRVEFSRPKIIAGKETDLLQTVTLTKGEYAAAQVGSPYETFGAISLDEVAAWRRARLNYESATLFEIVADANRYSQIPIVVAGDQRKLADFRVAAYFDANNLDEMLAIFPALFPVDIDVSDSARILVRIQ